MTLPRGVASCLLAFGVAASPLVAMAQDPIPDQAWYPADYHDMRVAAAHQLEDFPRDDRYVLMEGWDDRDAKTYDVIDCNLAYDLYWEEDTYQRQIGSLALDIARMRSEFAKLGYAREVYDQPLLDYERAALERFTAQRPDRLANPQKYRFRGEGGEDYGEDVQMQDWDQLGDLARALDDNRVRLNPAKPQIVSEGGCGAGETEFEIKLVPASGRLWLVNAFAFRVCERKVPDPWDHQACAWTQYVAGDTTFAAGRYMFEARWGSNVQRGAKLLQGIADGEVTEITFRRN